MILSDRGAGGQMRKFSELIDIEDVSQTHCQSLHNFYLRWACRRFHLVKKIKVSFEDHYDILLVFFCIDTVKKSKFL
jgi:hypothetical protein